MRTLSRTIDHEGMTNYALTGMCAQSDEACAERLVEFGCSNLAYARELVSAWRERRGETRR